MNYTQEILSLIGVIFSIMFVLQVLEALTNKATSKFKRKSR